MVKIFVLRSCLTWKLQLLNSIEEQAWVYSYREKVDMYIVIGGGKHPFYLNIQYVVRTA